MCVSQCFKWASTHRYGVPALLFFPPRVPALPRYQIEYRYSLSHIVMWACIAFLHCGACSHIGDFTRRAVTPWRQGREQRVTQAHNAHWTQRASAPPIPPRRVWQPGLRQAPGAHTAAPEYFTGKPFKKHNLLWLSLSSMRKRRKG